MDVENKHKQALAERASNIKSNAFRQIWVTFQFEGTHKYPAALEDSTLNREDEYDVSFLGYAHRHIFHFEVYIQVFHNDRDIEFIQFKRWCQKQFGSDEGTIDLNNQSCEMLADALYDKIALEFPGRKVEISVAEDNENGCHINYN